MNTHRIDESGFLDTKTPEQHFEDSTRGMLDSEFSCDAPREGMGIAGALILIVLGLMLGSVFYGIVRLVNWLAGDGGMSKADERFMAGSTAITREIALYLAAFFASIAGCFLAAELDLSWPAAIRLLASIAGA